jgi:hypothetical protein
MASGRSLLARHATGMIVQTTCRLRNPHAHPEVARARVSEVASDSRVGGIAEKSRISCDNVLTGSIYHQALERLFLISGYRY